MRRIFQRMRDLEKRIGQVHLEAKLRFAPKEPPAPLPVVPQFPPDYYLPENRRRFEELDAKIKPSIHPGFSDVRALTPAEISEWNRLFRMGFGSWEDRHRGERKASPDENAV